MNIWLIDGTRLIHSVAWLSNLKLNNFALICMDSLPAELLWSALMYLTIEELKFKSQLVCKHWRDLSLGVLNKKLNSCKQLLNRTSNDRYCIWLLANLDHPIESKVVTGFEFVLTGSDLRSGTLKFNSTSTCSFGKYSEELGYFPFTVPYPSTKFSFCTEFKPKFRLWFPSNVANLKLMRTKSLGPMSKATILNKEGSHLANLFGHGKVGLVEYDIEPCSKIISSVEDKLDVSILNMLQDDEKKVVGTLQTILLEPRAIFKCPI